MADVSRAIEIVFNGVDNVSSSLTTMGNNVSAFGDGMQDIGQPFADATEKVLLLDAAIAGIAIAGIKMSSDIEAEAIKMANSLGLPIEEAEKFKTIALDAYKGGYGDDLAASFEAVTLAQKKFGDNAAVDIGKVVTQASTLQTTFDVDINDSMSAVSTLMQNFGVDSETAMNLLADGYQKGLDGSGDLIQSITEYSSQFAEGGADAGQFFSVLQSGFSDGYLGADKAADLFKEFRLRISEETDSVNDALTSIGIDPVAWNANLASGELSAIDAFTTIQTKLGETKDKTVLFTAGIALMGSPFEDLGTTAALAINTTNTKLGEMAGKIDSIDTKTFEQNFTSALRTITTEFGSLKQWKAAKIKIAEVFGDIAASFGPAMEKVDFSGLEDAVGEVWTKIQNLFIDNDLDTTSVEGMQKAIQIVVDSIESLAEVTDGIVEILGPMVAKLVDVAEAFNGMDSDTKKLVGEIIGLGAALATLGGVVVTGGTLIVGLGTAFGLISKLANFSKGGQLLISFGIGWEIGGQIRKVLNLDEPIQKVIKAIDKQINFTGTMGEVDLGFDTPKIQEKVNAELGTITGKIDIEDNLDIVARVELEGKEPIDLWVEKLKDDKEVTVAVGLEGDQDITGYLQGLDGEIVSIEAVLEGDGSITEFFGSIDDEEVAVRAALEGDETVKKTISSFYANEEGNKVWVPVDTEEITDAKADIETIPTEKFLEIKLQGEIDTEIAEITTSAETAQEAFKYTAEVKIAEAQASAQVLTQAFKSAGDSVVALSDSTADMFGALLDGWGELSMLDQMDFMDLLEDQQDAQTKALESQIKLNDAQLKYLDAKAKALSNGDGLIKIDTTGVEPALEMVMWEIIEKVQIRASEESADFLLGL